MRYLSRDTDWKQYFEETRPRPGRLGDILARDDRAGFVETDNPYFVGHDHIDRYLAEQRDPLTRDDPRILKPKYSI